MTVRWRVTLEDENGDRYKLAIEGETMMDAVNNIEGKHRDRKVLGAKRIKRREK